jgi:hypothetical protein
MGNSQLKQISASSLFSVPHSLQGTSAIEEAPLVLPIVYRLTDVDRLQLYSTTLYN